MHAAVLANALQQIHVRVISFVLYKIDPANETNLASNTLLTLSRNCIPSLGQRGQKPYAASGTSPYGPYEGEPLPTPPLPSPRANNSSQWSFV